jgi:predicted nucleic acid-binding protein
MARIIVLDSGPLGDACRRRGKADVEALNDWSIATRAKGAILAIPEIADYEVRRGLLLAEATRGIERLDRLKEGWGYAYIPISTAAMRKAAELRAQARSRGQATADDRALDADVILAAQALLFAGLGDELTVATYNPHHLSRYVVAQHWRDINP